MDKKSQGAILTVTGALLLLVSVFSPEVLPFGITIVIDTTPPYVESINPDGTESLPGAIYPGGTISITVCDDTSGLNEFYLSRISGTTVIKLISETSLGGITRKTFTYTMPADVAIGTVYKFVVFAVDRVGNQMPNRYFWVKVSPKPKYTLTVNIDGQGNVSILNYGNYTQPVQFDMGTTITLRAIPSPGWDFRRWTGAKVSESDTISITMDSDKSLTAFFEQKPSQFYITVNSVPSSGGSVTPSSGYYGNGQVVSFQANPNLGYRFSRFEAKGASSTSNPICLTIDSSFTVTAYFEKVETPTGIFFVNNLMVKDSVLLNTKIINFTFVPTGSAEAITRVYAEIQGQQTVQLLKQPNGSYAAIWTAPGGGSYLVDAKMDWTGGSGVRIVSFTLSISIEENVSPLPPPSEVFLIYYSCSPPEGGAISGKVLRARKGEVIHIEAIPNEGYRFKKWTGDIYSFDPQTSFTVEKDMTIIAVFEKIEKAMVLRNLFIISGALLVLIGLLRIVL